MPTTKAMLVGLSADSRLYTVRCGNGYSCLGFDVAYRVSVSIAAWCGEAPPDPTLVGTPAGFDDYGRLVAVGAAHAARTKTRCYADLTPQLVGLEGRRVEVVEHNGEIRRFQVGRSMGWMPVHLELARYNSTGGSAVTGAPFRSVRVIR